MSFCSEKEGDDSVPKQDRSRQTYERILVAAENLFAEKGWDGLNTNAIAQAAGVSIGSLYRYFPDKSAVLRALAERAAAPLLEGMDALLARKGRIEPGLVLDSLPSLADARTPPGSLCLNRLQGGGCSEEVGEIAAEVEKALEERLSRLFLRLEPGMHADAARAKAALARGLVSAAVASAAREPELAPRLEAELRVLLEALLQPRNLRSNSAAGRGLPR
jgi:Transcriptional regulator